MTRLCLSLLLALFCVGASAQQKHAQPKKTATPKPLSEIHFHPNGGFVILPEGGDGLRSFFIPLDLHGRADKDQNLRLRIHSFDAPFTHPKLAQNSVNFVIPANQFSKTGGDTLSRVVCTVELNSMDSLPEKEKAFIVKEGEEDNPFTLVMESEVPAGRATNTTGKEQDPPVKEKAKDDSEVVKGADPAQKIIVSLVNSDTSFNPVITSDETTRTYSVKLHFHANGTTPADTIQVPLEIDTLNAGNLKPELKITTVTIFPEDWSHKDSQNNIIKMTRVQLKSVPSFEHDESFYIRQKGDNANLAEIRITTVGLYNPNKPFWVEVGANFDFADGLKPNNFFGGVFLHKRDIRPIFSGNKKGDKPKRLGLFAGVFESKTVSDITSEEFSIQRYYNDRSALLKRNDSVGAFVDTGKMKTTQVVKNIGLFFSPQVRLTNGSANADGLHVAISAWLELQWQTISSKVDYSAMRRSDTFYVPRKALDTTVKRLNFGSDQDIRSHYLGIGLPIFFKDGDANVFFNPVIGLSTQPSSKDMQNFTDSTDRKWRPFYIFQFRLNEEHFGMAFTGEVRGLIMHGSKPLVSLALTKKFDLSKFLEFK